MLGRLSVLLFVCHIVNVIAIVRVCNGVDLHWLHKPMTINLVLVVSFYATYLRIELHIRKRHAVLTHNYKSVNSFRQLFIDVY